MTVMRSVAEVEDEVAQLRDLDPAALRARWRIVSGRAAPKHLPRHLLLRMLAYRVQADAFGDLGRDSVRYLERLAAGESAPAPAARPRPGTVLVREWNGLRHHVMVDRGGCSWNGRRFGSLSEVASAITGTRWSGPRFFGVGQHAKPKSKGSQDQRTGS